MFGWQHAQPQQRLDPSVVEQHPVMMPSHQFVHSRGAYGKAACCEHLLRYSKASA